MTTPARSIVKVSAATTTFETYPMPKEILVEGDPKAQVHWVHASTEGAPTYYAGLWTAEPSVFDWTFELSETAHILEGHVVVTQQGGPTVELRAGDVAFFPKGTVTRWHVRERLKKVFVDAP
jgi:uncharacterized cupin superfamily protein